MFFGFKEKFDPSIKQHLRVVSSAGEPLTPEVVNWFKQDLGSIFLINMDKLS
jgi:acetyl-CoA synthetase